MAMLARKWIFDSKENQNVCKHSHIPTPTMIRIFYLHFSDLVPYIGRLMTSCAVQWFSRWPR